METDSDCSICLEDLNKKQTYTLPCGHIFHTECQINWFRSKQVSCPKCRSSKTLGDLPFAKYNRNNTAFQIMSYRARRKDAPIGLKNKYKSYKNITLNIKTYTKKLKEIRKSNGNYSEIEKKINAIHRKLYRYKSNARRIRWEIANLCEIVTVYTN